MPWGDEDARDDWDDIADALYRRLVVETLAWGVIDPGELPAEAWRASQDNLLVLEDVHGEDELRLPRYGLNYFSYRDTSFIGVEVERRKAPRVFVGFGSNESPFDTVFCRTLTRREAPRDFEELDLELASFTLMHLRPQGRDRIKTLSIPG